MTKQDEPMPSDQYARVIEELRRFSVVIDEMQKDVEMVRGLDAIEARRCFVISAQRLQEAGYWFGQGLKFSKKAT